MKRGIITDSRTGQEVDPGGTGPRTPAARRRGGAQEGHSRTGGTQEGQGGGGVAGRGRWTA